MKKWCFAWGILEKQDQCPGPLGSHPPPSAACGWVLSVGTGLPPQTPSDFLFVYTRLMLLVLLVALTRRRSRRIYLRADATAADTRGYMGPCYELHGSVLGARDLKKSLKTIGNLWKSMKIIERSRTPLKINENH